MDLHTNIFIDCGFHLDEGLSSFNNTLHFDKNWVIYTFEANPDCHMDNKIPNFGCPIHSLNKAVWIHNHGVTFYQESNIASNSPKENSTSNLDGWGSCISDLQSSHTFDKQISVPSIDFSEWLFQFRDYKIYCKMDIEVLSLLSLGDLLKPMHCH